MRRNLSNKRNFDTLFQRLASFRDPPKWLSGAVLIVPRRFTKRFEALVQGMKT
jgi:hypothetical protein